MIRNRLAQAVFIVGVVGAAWAAMMAVHELGHVLAAWATGGRVAEVHLPGVWGFSYTAVDPNPRPRVERWAGPLVGVALPLAAWGVAAAVSRLASSRVLFRGRGRLLLRWFAGFCCIANGAYLGVGWIDGVGDAGDLLRHGTPVWQLILFGAVLTPLGLALWHRTGPAFGLGADASPIPVRTAAIAAALFVLASLAEVHVTPMGPS